MNRQQHGLQQPRHVVIGPSRGVERDAGDRLRLRKVGPAQPHVHLQFGHQGDEYISAPAAIGHSTVYLVSCSRRSRREEASVAGSPHVKSRHMYAVGLPPRISIGPRNGNALTSPAWRDPGSTGTMTLKGRYFPATSRISSPASRPGPTMTIWDLLA